MELPASLTPIVGRTHELTAVGEALRRARLVTLAGPGGVGKTCLGLEVARRQAARSPGSVWLVDLAPVADAASIPAEVARALGVSVPPRGSATDALRRALAGARPLLVLDNCEHVVEACARLTGALLETCPGVRVLATSREPLGVDGEIVWRLEPLPAAEATRLFAERARQRSPEFLATGEAETTVARLCERLDRLPLAIELAAARVSLMTPSEILARLGGRGPDLVSSGRLAAPRHHTLRATIDWSYRLLDREEQDAFRSLSVFVGSFDADAALAVADAGSLDVLARLVDKSLVAVEATRAGTTRYRLLETIRERAAELLVEAGELDAARERHLRHLATLAGRALEEWLSTGAQRLVNDLDDDYENVRAALERSVSSTPCAGLRLLGGTRDLFYRFGQADGLRLAQALLERCTVRDRHRIVGLIAAGQLAAMRMELETARRALREAAELSAELGEPALAAWTSFFQGLAGVFGGSFDEAGEHFRASRELHRKLGIRRGEARALLGLASGIVTAGDLAGGRELMREALSICVAEDDGWGQGTCHTWLGLIAEASGSDPTGATRHFRTAVELLRPSRDRTLLPMALAGQAGVLGRTDWGRAVRVAAAACAGRDRVGGSFPLHIQARIERVRSAGAAALGPDFERAWRDGGRMTIDEAVDLAFGASRPAAPAPAGLSGRELEVAALVAEGLSNKAIAARLQLSIRTVESHVRNALAKVGAGNRTQLATWARDHAQ
jgi:predicted ATPase/DNA-binding CsgD family transcriptional regulator